MVVGGGEGSGEDKYVGWVWGERPRECDVAWERPAQWLGAGVVGDSGGDADDAENSGDCDGGSSGEKNKIE